ncbi:hypothetical protein DLAC_07479 [Tieghemostelium lacteum]|uniref:Uncharacterized protein n=1 Tax=Tieghemostelium lacteum TaxID=361077 RepID=A0A151ZCM5_TIELA|nr:hypothetical protein DLAC_07479 [Tieghemostelium lacteum]|eukprot:KYQ91698.1 hypothetical protein DLAC_07479 [Tieghemostelium lacteum]
MDNSQDSYSNSIFLNIFDDIDYINYNDGLPVLDSSIQSDNTETDCHLLFYSHHKNNWKKLCIYYRVFWGLHNNEIGDDQIQQIKLAIVTFNNKEIEIDNIQKNIKGKLDHRIKELFTSNRFEFLNTVRNLVGQLKQEKEKKGLPYKNKK